jgi:hypothetical protein
MKRYVVIIALLALTMMLMAKPMYQVNLGIDMAGTQTAKVSGVSVDTDSKLGISPSFEVLMPAMPNLLVGGGLEYQLGRGLKDSGDAKFGFIPIYVTAKYAVTKTMPVVPEVIVDLGYDIFTGNSDYKGDGDLSGGLCWAIGAGINHPKGYNLQIMYRSFAGQWSLGGTDVDITQGNLSFLLGCRF